MRLACLNWASSYEILLFLAIVNMALCLPSDLTPLISSFIFLFIDFGPFANIYYIISNLNIIACFLHARVIQFNYYEYNRIYNCRNSLRFSRGR